MMLEAAAVPVLLQAVHWIFDESSKILEERRMRSRAQQEDKGTQLPDVHVSTAQDLASTLAHPDGVIRTKEAALRHPVAELAWQNAESHVKHLLALLAIHTKNYHLAKTQYAKWGGALVPPIIANNLAEAEDEIVSTTKELQATLSLVYGARVAGPEVERG